MTRQPNILMIYADRMRYDCAGFSGNPDVKTPGQDPEIETEAQIRKFVVEYYGMISNVEFNVGRLLKWLDAQGIAEDTIVVFFSDHGDMLVASAKDGAAQGATIFARPLDHVHHQRVRRQAFIDGRQLAIGDLLRQLRCLFPGKRLPGHQ